MIFQSLFCLFLTKMTCSRLVLEDRTPGDGFDSDLDQLGLETIIRRENPSQSPPTLNPLPQSTTVSKVATEKHSPAGPMVVAVNSFATLLKIDDSSDDSFEVLQE